MTENKREKRFLIMGKYSEALLKSTHGHNRFVLSFP